MAGPLDGIRIIDLTAMISGPYATMILADQGADVIKVEIPGRGDHVRAGGNRSGGLPASFLNNNRNKRSITIDLKSERGIEVLKKLAASADVFIQNFRPGVVDRMGIGEADIRKASPDIIYVSISGFGEEGPFSHKPVYDPIIQALSGLASVQGGGDRNRPRLVRTILPDKLTGVTASQAITAALLARERTGTAQHVRLSMLDTVLSFLWSSDMGGQTFIGKEVSEARAASFIDLIYETKNGNMSVAVMNDREWEGFCYAAECPEWLEDERFKTPELRDINIDARLELIQSRLITDTTEAWMEKLDAHRVPCAPVLTRSALLDHPQIKASTIIVETEHPDAGPLRQAMPAARFEKTPTSIRRPAPQLGADTEALLDEIGLAADEIADLRDAKVVGH
jgi:crotonobetainyl-CoA:carnitine CoA-transferase CaiB-like acyl-CoA transferase